MAQYSRGTSALDDPAVTSALDGDMHEMQTFNFTPQRTTANAVDELEFRDFNQSISEEDAKLEDSSSLLGVSAMSSGAAAFSGQPSASHISVVSDTAAAESASYFSVEYYQQFFDVDSEQILGRLLRALSPWKPFFLPEDPKADLYGPFWIATTLVFLVAVAGNLVSYLAYLPSSKSPVWRYDMQKMTSAATMFYGAITLLPLAASITLSRVLLVADLALSKLICLWGYSLTAFVPVSLLCIIPSDLFHYLVFAAGFAFSVGFLLKQVYPVIPQAVMKPYGFALLGSIALTHFGLVAACKLYFFNFS
jgi:hypothetical protein